MKHQNLGLEIKSIIVKAVWDSEAKVWIATSTDVPGLVTEADSPDQLIENLQALIPELLDLNGDVIDGEIEVPLFVMSEQLSKVRLGVD